MKVITKNNVIIEICNTAQVTSNGILVDNYIIGVPTDKNGEFTETILIHDVEVIPSDVTVNNYCYDGTNFYPIVNETNSPQPTLEDKINFLYYREKGLI